jgi:predicted KAP-like P-loop ATPase
MKPSGKNLQFRNESWDGVDLLGRRVFAEQLAQRIKIWKNKESLVIGLFGEWGNGKTVTKSMVLQILGEDKADCPFVIEFNPWEWSGHEIMTTALIGQVRAKLGKKDNDQFAKKAAKFLKKYELYLRATVFGIEGLGKAMVLAPIIVAFISFFYGSITDSKIFKIVGGIGFLLSLLLPFLTFWQRLFERFATALSYSKEEKTLRELKDETRQALLELKKPLLVIVDDVDRLSAEEIRNLFQLVKANLDFPNIIYFLVFQKDVIAKALEKSFVEGSGNEYLKKIIQVGFDLPRIERCRLEEVLRKELEKLISEHGLQVQKNRIDEAFNAGFGRMFKNLRDVYRFFDAMDFYLGVLNKSGSLEVDTVDLAVLETIRQSEVEMYSLIPHFRLELLRRAEGMATFLKKDAEKDAEYRKTIEQLLDKTSMSNKDIVRELLKMLFPPLYSASSENENTWFREFRVCDSDGFDRYFLLSVPMGAMSKNEVDKIMSVVGDVQRLCAILAEFHHENRLYDALRYLGANEPNIDSNMAFHS